MVDSSVVNVCFHGIGTPSRELERGESPYWVTEKQFMSILDEIARWPTVQISFDDGNESDVTVGLPALIERGLTATFFPLAGRLGLIGSVDAAGIRELVAAGMTVGSHGMDHRPWRGMDAAMTGRELVQARSQIAAVADRTVDHAALPLGRYDRRLLRNLKRLGYQRIYNSDRRLARVGQWHQPRFSVHDDETVRSLRAAVASARSPYERVRLEATGLLKRLR